MDIREVFARNLRRHRRAARLSQEELAHRSDIDRTYISSLERSVYAASIDVVDRLAAALEKKAGNPVRPRKEGACARWRTVGNEDACRRGRSGARESPARRPGGAFVVFGSLAV